MNLVSLWLNLIGTPERARKLRARLDNLSSPELDPSFGPEPAQCPTTVLFGAEVSRKLYTDPDFRPALDAWDSGEVSKGDLRRYCLWIEKGHTVPTFSPDAFWLERLHSASIENAYQAALLRRTPEQHPSESRGSTRRAKRPASRGTARHS